MPEHNGIVTPEEEARREKKREKMRRYRANRAARELLSDEPIDIEQEQEQEPEDEYAGIDWEEAGATLAQIARAYPRVALGIMGAAILGAVVLAMYQNKPE